ncbi:hypothetical protein ACJX0J_010272 [Zea mays]
MSDSYCPDCKKQTEVAFDHSAGDTVCTECGLVLEAHSVDETSEWRTFTNESNDNDPVRVGGPSNPLLTDGGLSTVIAKPNGAQGDFLSSSLGRWQNRGSNPDRSLILAFRTIANMADSVAWIKINNIVFTFGITESICHTSFVLTFILGHHVPNALYLDTILRVPLYTSHSLGFDVFMERWAFLAQQAPLMLK